MVVDSGTKTEERRQLVEIMGQTALSEAPSILIPLAKSENDPTVLAAVFVALQAFELPEAAEAACNRMNQLNGDVRLAAETLLTSRASYARRYVSDVAAESLPEIWFLNRLCGGCSFITTHSFGNRSNPSGARLREHPLHKCRRKPVVSQLCWQLVPATPNRARLSTCRTAAVPSAV